MINTKTVRAQSGGGGGPRLARRLGLFDATMIVMGGIVGAGIFINPYVVARQVRTPVLILGAWLAGGLIALAGAFVYAELAARRPEVGGQYAYLRDAYHPSLAFIYGWTLLLVTQTGGMAAVAVTFSRYFLEITRAPLSEGATSVIALALLTAVNCLGVRSGSSVQSGLMVLKILAIAGLVACGLWFVPAGRFELSPALPQSSSLGLLAAFGAALTPVMFAYGGWQTASFVSGEMRDPSRDLTRGLLLGVAGVIILYTSVSFVCVYALGAEGLAGTDRPASDVMRLAFGERGAALIAVGIAVSTLGFLSQGMLTAPRVYYAMAQDGVFFKSVGLLSQGTRAPVVAIALQGVLAAVIALSGRYEQILNYVVSVDFIWFGLTAASVFVYRRAAADAREDDDSFAEPKQGSGTGAGDDLTGRGGFRVPGHPFTTAFFAAACAFIVVSTVYADPRNSAIGLSIMAAGLPAYLLWKRRRRR